MEAGLLRIGELSRRTGVSPELLRAWERRYGLLQPVRSQGGLRLYRPRDLERVLRMQQHLADGLAAAEAAVLVAESESGSEGLAFDPARVRSDLGAALEAFDESAAQAILDSVISTTTLDTTLSEIVLPYLHELGLALGAWRGLGGPGALRDVRPQRPAARSRLGAGVVAMGRARCSRASRASSTTSG